MNIREFKEDDIITRVEPSEHCGDLSYLGDKFLFVGVDKGLIFLIKLDKYYIGMILKLETDIWSEGWDFYPHEMEKKAIDKLKVLGKE